MKKIILALFVVIFTIISCKKTSSCYDCNVTATGNDTVICNKTQKQIDDMVPNTLNGCIKSE